MIHSLGQDDNRCATAFERFAVRCPVNTLGIARRNNEMLARRGAGTERSGLDAFLRSISGTAEANRMLLEKGLIPAQVQPVRRSLAEHHQQPVGVIRVPFFRAHC